jgi:hypothetical protein
MGIWTRTFESDDRSRRTREGEEQERGGGRREEKQEGRREGGREGAPDELFG